MTLGVRDEPAYERGYVLVSDLNEEDEDDGD